MNRGGRGGPAGYGGGGGYGGPGGRGGPGGAGGGGRFPPGGGRGGDFGRGGGRGGGRGRGPRVRYEAADIRVAPCPPEIEQGVLPEKYMPPAASGRPLDDLVLDERRALPRGVVGNKIRVICNVVAAKVPDELVRDQYRVDFTPELEEPRRRRYAVRTVMRGKTEKWTYDGDHILYASDLGGSLEATVDIIQNPDTKEEVPHQVKITHVRDDRTESPGLDRKCMMLFATTLRSAMCKLPGMQMIGQDLFDTTPENVIDVPQYSAQLLPGTLCSLYMTKSGPLLTTDLIYKHMRTDTVWSMVEGWAIDKLKGNMVGKVCITNYGKRKTFIVDTVRSDLSPNSEFSRKAKKDGSGGGATTYAAYFRTTYGLHDSDLDRDQPLLENVSRKEFDAQGQPKVTHFVPSLCHLTGLTDEMKADRHRGRDMIKLTAPPPHTRLQRIHKALVTMKANEDFNSILGRWGMDINTEMVEMDARRLPTAQLSNANGPVVVNEERESWDVKFNWPMFRSARFNKWAVVCTDQNATIRNFMDNMQRVSGDLNVPMGPPRYFFTGGRQTHRFVDTIKGEVAAAGPEFVMVIIPRENEEPYKTVKHYLCTVAGVASQFVTEYNIAKDPLLKATKILVQMNCKAQGAPWKVELKLGKPTMFVGLDVHHGGDLEHRDGSVAGFVATLDAAASCYYSRSFVVRKREQMMVPVGDGPGLRDLMIGAIQAFTAKNKVAPATVVVYRDGGSEGQLKGILDHEVKEIKAAIDAEAAGCGLAFLVVLKSIRTRIFEREPTTDRVAVGNPPPGTCVDTHIVNNYIPEFFLVCQNVNQGSATPTKYQKIYDTTNLNTDTLQMYTYLLAHMYYNWFGTVRVPCVLKYASTCAKFTGSYLRGSEHPSHKLCQSLFYL